MTLFKCLLKLISPHLVIFKIYLQSKTMLNSFISIKKYLFKKQDYIIPLCKKVNSNNNNKHMCS